MDLRDDPKLFRVATLAAGLVLASGALLLGVLDRPAPSVVLFLGAAIVFVVIAVFTRRLSQLKIAFGQDGVELSATMAEVATTGGEQFAEEVARAGLLEVAATYAFVHDRLRRPEQRDLRVQIQDLLVESVADTPLDRAPSAAAIKGLLQSPSPAVRVLALGFLYRDRTLVSAEILRTGIAESRSGNEQFHAMKLAERSWKDLTATDRADLAGLLRSNPHIQQDGERRALAERLLEAEARLRDKGDDATEGTA